MKKLINNKKVNIFVWNRWHDMCFLYFDDLMKDPELLEIVNWVEEIDRGSTSVISKSIHDKITVDDQKKQSEIFDNLSKFDIIFSASYLVDFKIGFKTMNEFNDAYKNVKPKSQTHIEIWHGPLAKRTQEWLGKDSSVIDFFISITPFTTRKLIHQLGYDKEQILEVSPSKIDALKKRYENEFSLEDFFKRHNFSEKKEYTLYSPTWIRRNNNEVTTFNLDELLEEIETEVLIVCPHPHILAGIEVDWEYDDKFKDRVIINKDPSIWSWHLMFDAKFGYSAYSSTIIDFYNLLDDSKVKLWTKGLPSEIIRKQKSGFCIVNDEEFEGLNKEHKFFKNENGKNFVSKIKKIILDKHKEINR